MHADRRADGRTVCQSDFLFVCLSVGRLVVWLVGMVMCVDRQTDCMYACTHRYKERKKQEKKSLQLSYSHQSVLLHD